MIFMPTVFPPQFGNLPQPAEFFARGLQMRQQLQMQREQLQAQREAASLQAQVRMQEAASQAARDQQRMMVEDSYNRAQLGLQQQQLQQAQQNLDFATQEAGRRYQMEQTFLNEGRQAIAAGEAPERVWPRLTMQYGPLITGSMAGMAALAEQTRAPTEFTPPKLVELGETGGRKINLIFDPRSGKWQQPYQVKEFEKEALTDVEKDELAELGTRANAIEERWAGTPVPEEGQTMYQQYQRDRSALEQINKERQRIRAGARARGGRDTTEREVPTGARKRSEFPANQRFVRDRSGRVWAYMGTEQDPKLEKDTSKFIPVSD